ncbi:zinc ribbon domain-containing protein [Parasulfuritortus cantonensis]|uniref:Zinc ribbon domain-containing protein n=1 Tax=Parasulfuritortus cantonensis TaxID=2528202 RepID=A0A4R1B1G7_9PROT|nr:zinc ribbon domain-containing protein [Parasulfuritortus cantonensis]TCJ11621.1 zinc ribbon domain-containing protein [Parasulfuritortus cantonensis]
MIYCRSCGKQLHESARFCPQCGFNFQPVEAPSPSIWMAVTALVLSILTLLLLLATFGDMDTLNTLSQLESAFGSHSLKKKLAEDAANSAAGGLVFGLPAGVLGIVSLMQKRGGRGMGIASLVIGGINLLLILGLFGLSLE